jgi:hypothetical protein
MLSQLETQTMEDLSTKDFAYQKTFINEKQLGLDLSELYKKLEIMEVEGRYFQLNKSTLKVEDRPRTDKAYMMEIANIQNFEDM